MAENTTFIVILGDPVGGFIHVGTFASHEEATSYADNNVDNGDRR